MKKNYKQKVIKENMWGLHFTRWYVVAPSGNKYNFWRGCYSSTLHLPLTFNALSIEKKELVSKEEWFHTEDYREMIKEIYRIEDCGGFPEQNQINEWIENKREYRVLFSRKENSISYDTY